MKPFVTTVCAGLLILSTATVSDARPYARQLPSQSDADSYGSNYDNRSGRDSSCFSRTTGIPDQYACSRSGG